MGLQEVVLRAGLRQWVGRARELLGAVAIATEVAGASGEGGQAAEGVK